MKLGDKVIIFGVSIIAVIVASVTVFERPQGSLGLQPWHFDFSEVRAYRMNWDDKYSLEGIEQAEGLNDTRVPVEGILLSDEQVELLRQAVLHDKPVVTVSMCLYPHHAFVFYNQRQEVVGYYDVCFLCNTTGSKPEGFSFTPNFPMLKRLLAQLDIPLSNPDWVEQGAAPQIRPRWRVGD